MGLLERLEQTKQLLKNRGSGVHVNHIQEAINEIRLLRKLQQEQSTVPTTEEEGTDGKDQGTNSMADTAGHAGGSGD